MNRAVALAALACAVLLAVATNYGPTSDVGIHDFRVYRTYSELILDGFTPYRDFLVEYPPLAFVPMLAGAVFGTDDGTYRWVFGVLVGLALVGILFACAALARERRIAAAWAVALSPLIAGALIRTHFDVFPVVLALAGLVAVTRHRPVLAFGLLGLATMTKWFPAVIAAVVAAWLLGRGQREAVWKGAAVFAAICVVASAPFLGSGYVDAHEFHLDRPVQIESTPASVAFLLGGIHTTGPFTPHPDEFRSQGVDGGPADTLAVIFGIALLAMLAVIVWLASRRDDEHQLLLASVAAVLAFMALGKVLSPQYMIWLIPVLALAVGLREYALALCTATAMILTQFEFPGRYFDLVTRDDGVIALVAVRNMFLLVALALAVRKLWARRGPARSSPPAAAATP